MKEKPQLPKLQNVITNLDLKTMVASAPIGICVLDASTLISEITNDKFVEIAGKPYDAIVGKHYWDTFAEAKPYYEKEMQRVIAKGVTFQANEVALMLIRHGEEEKVYVTFVYVPMKDTKGKVEKVAVWVLENTQQVVSRKKIEESEEKYRNLFSNMDQGFCIVEVVCDINKKPVDYHVLEVNPMFEHQTGLKNAVGKTAKELGLEQHWINLYGKVALTGKSARFTQDSAMLERWFDVSAFKIGDKESRKVAILFTDITVRRKNDEALKESEARFRAIADDAPVFIFLAGENAEVEYLNKTWRDYTGITDDKSKGRAWAEITHPDDVDPATKIYMDGFNRRVSCSFENRQKGTDGVYRTILWKANPRFSPSGKFIGMMGVGLDIHERKRLEQQKDEFIGIASHELKTPVTSIKAYTQVLHSRLLKEGNEALAKHLAKMDGQLDKLTSLIGDLLDSTKIDAGKLQFDEKNFDFNELVIDIVDEIQRTTDRHRIKTKLKKTKIVYGDRDRIGQVITNLLTNASKYSPNANKIVVETSTEDNTITLSVQDFGIGISKKKQEKVFERFYRADEREHHETYAGLGLGLYISEEIIKRHGGKIWVTSKVGKGSIFHFSLPIKKSSKKKKI